MRRVVLVGEGASAESLRRLLADAGAEVTLCAPRDEILGRDCSMIVVDELHAKIDAAMRNAALTERVPAGLLPSLTSTALRSARELVVVGLPQARPDARTYLKRKKGRSGTGAGRCASTPYNGLAKRKFRA